MADLTSFFILRAGYLSGRFRAWAILAKCLQAELILDTWQSGVILSDYIQPWLDCLEYLIILVY